MSSSSESSSVPAAAVEATAKETKESVIRATDDFVRREQSLPPIRPPGVSEYIFHAFPRLRELLRDGEGAAKSLVRMQEEIMRQFRKVLVHDEVKKVDDDDGGHCQETPPGRR